MIYTHLATSTSTAQPMVHVGRRLRPAPHMRNETFLEMSMIPSQTFKADDSWYCAHLCRDTSTQPYDRQPYYSAKPLPSQRLSMSQIILLLAMSQVALQLNLETCHSRSSVETLVIRNVQCLAHDCTAFSCTYAHIRSAYTIGYLTD